MTAQNISAALAYIDDGILMEAESVRSRERVLNPASIKAGYGRTLKRTLLIAAAAAVLLTMCGLAARYLWHMPERGEQYEGDMIAEHGVQSYPLPDGYAEEEKNADAAAEENTVTQGMEKTPVAEETESLRDEYFIGQAVDVLKIVRKLDVDAETLTVTRQTNQIWSREEAVVRFTDADGNSTDVRFDAEKGVLIGVTAFDKVIPGGTPMSEDKALEAAKGFYYALPYEKGYVYRSVSKFDDHAWMYSFSKPMEFELFGEAQTLYSSYEEVRITIDPCTGDFQLSNAFFVPLLDDHAEGAKPLTQEEAVTRVLEYDVVYGEAEDYDVSAQIVIALPRPEIAALYRGETEDFSGNYKYYGLTRLAWEITFTGREKDMLGYYSESIADIDLYTGELLAVDGIK